jgi:hypothetical protein
MRRSNGFISIPVEDEVIEYAVSIRKDRDSKLKNIFQEKNTDMRHVGEVGELAFGHYLNQYRADLTKWLVDGKVTHQPDFIFAGQKIGVKTVKRKVDMKMDYLAQITASHQHEPVDFYFFCCFETHTHELVLLGGIEKKRFLEQGKHWVAGEYVHANYQIRQGHEIITICVDQLIQPDRFIRGLLNHYDAKKSEAA